MWGRGYSKGPPIGCGTWLILFLIFITSPFWIYLLIPPLQFLVFIGETGETLFGKGNGIILFFILGIVFFVLVLFIGRKIERHVYQKKDHEDKEM